MCDRTISLKTIHLKCWPQFLSVFNCTLAFTVPKSTNTFTLYSAQMSMCIVGVNNFSHFNHSKLLFISDVACGAVFAKTTVAANLRNSSFVYSFLSPSADAAQQTDEMLFSDVDHLCAESARRAQIERFGTIMSHNILKSCAYLNV